MDLGLKGRTALVTGASKGIGLAIAGRFAVEGVNLVLVARGEGDLDRVAEDLRRSHGITVKTVPIDLSRAESARALSAAHGDVDILVNNAGAIPRGDLLEIDQAEWRRAWDLKVFGHIDMTRAFYARMKARGAGVVVNVIGAGGERLDARYICGSTANAALMAFTRALGGASPDDGIRVVGVNPGPIATERLVTLLEKEAVERFDDPRRWTELTGSMPFGRPGLPEEVAATVAFVASDLSGYTSGTIVTVDGGYSHRQV